jgi:cysteinyl-tRNA synthetase
MKLFNTLSRSKQEFFLEKQKKIKIYVCGPTVYDYIHIGNARPICVFDVLRRYLEYRGCEVVFVQNFTDIDDKIINKATKEAKNFEEISEKYQFEYEKDAKGLNIIPATFNPKATQNIESIQKLITKLLEKGYAYETQTGDVYFRTEKFESYGKLSHQPLSELEAGARINVDETKESPMDFAMWKAAKPGEPFWESPWGNGRPGWHIECSAMINRYLGETIDIHCGGQDLIFPHHENEIAQSECATGMPLAKFWLHNGYINIDNKKMSKSLGNFFTVRDIAKEYGYEPIRYLMIASHYRSPINYSTDILKQCKSSLERLYNCKNYLEFLLGQTKLPHQSDCDEGLTQNFLEFEQRFVEALEDDLNTAGALSVLFETAKFINIQFENKDKISKNIVLFAKNLFFELADILGILYEQKKEPVEPEIEELIQKRELARESKDFVTADEIRDRLSKMGVLLEDTPEGARWKRGLSEV